MLPAARRVAAGQNSKTRAGFSEEVSALSENYADMLNAAGRPFGELIREYRKRKGLSQEQLGSIAGVKKNAVGAWEAGRSRPDVASIPMLCRELEIPLHVFFGLSEEVDTFRLNERFNRLNDYNRQVILHEMDMLYGLQQRQEMPEPRLRRIIPLFRNDISAAAGPVSYLEGNGGEMIYVAADETTSQADEIIRVSGDSMEPSFFDGDQVLVRHTNLLKEGEIGIFVNGDAGYIKEYRADGLYSHNGKYPPIRFTENDAVRCVGRVLGTLHPAQIATEAEIAHFNRNRL